MNDVQYLTQEGMVEMEARLKYLTQQKRMEVAERLRQALAEGGDLSENAEYEDAKNEQAFVEGEIQRLETIITSAEIIETTTGRRISRTWCCNYRHRKRQQRKRSLPLVGSAEANPREGKISVESPLGRHCWAQKSAKM